MKKFTWRWVQNNRTIAEQSQRQFYSNRGYFEGTFSLQVKADSNPYEAPPRCVAYALQIPFKN